MKIISVASYVICVCLLVFYRIRRLRQRGENREAAVYALIMAVSAVIGSLMLAGVKLPSLVVPYKLVFEPIGKRILSP